MTFAKLKENFYLVARVQTTVQPQPAIQPVVQLAVPHSELVTAEAIGAESACKVCRGIHYWKPKASTRWLCFKCSPPPVPEFIGEERGGLFVNPDSVVRTGKTTAKGRLIVLKVHYCRGGLYEKCPECLGRMVSETTFDDGDYSVHCATCNYHFPKEMLS